MRYLITFVIFAALFSTLLVGEVAVAAPIVQTPASAPEKAASLRAQLSNIETKQAELQTRLQTLDEGLKPENIESALAGVGSTHPEDLREQRRRQLEIERNGVRAQLDLLNTSHSRLETAIAAADADAYRQSAAPPKGPAIDPSSTTAADSTTVTASPDRPRHAKKKRKKKSRRMVVGNI